MRTSIGRDPDHLKVLPGLSVIVGARPRRRRKRITSSSELADPSDRGREILSTMLGDMDLRLTRSTSRCRIAPAERMAARTLRQHRRDGARRDNLTIRQLAQRVAGARAKNVLVGTPKQVADYMEEWFVEEARATASTSCRPICRARSTISVNLVIPELQRRGLFRTEYDGRTLREHLGLPRPPSRYAAALPPKRRSRAATAFRSARSLWRSSSRRM